MAELSTQLRELPIHPESSRTADFRSPGSVSRKTGDIMTAHSSYKGKPTKGGKLTREVVREFENDTGRLAAQAATVRGQTTRRKVASPSSIVDPDLGVPVAEGRVLERVHLARERDSSIRDAKIRSVAAAGEAIACEACGFDFEATYGQRGLGYIEVHHRVPLHVSGPTETLLDDLALLCSNCHRMIHRATPWLTVEELTTMVADRSRT